MRVLVIGTGAREHALCLALARDPAVRHVVCAPGNAGTAQLAETRTVDPLDDIERIPVCVGYRVGDTVLDEMPMTRTEFHHAVPVYEEFPGWEEDISGAKDLDDLPKNAQSYVKAVEELSGAPISANRRRPRPRPDRRRPRPGVARSALSTD